MVDSRSKHDGDDGNPPTQSAEFDEAVTYSIGSSHSEDRPQACRPAVTPMLPSNCRVLLLAVCLAFGNMVFSLLTNSTVVMLDVLADSLDITENNLQWIFNSLQLPFGCCIRIAGKAADIYGRKAVFLTGQSMMVIATLITGFMRNEKAFYVFRALSGLAGALITASNFGLVAEVTRPGRLRSICMGILFAGQTTGGALGFASSGSLVEATGWRTVFYLVAGLYVIPLVGVFFLAQRIKTEHEKPDKRIDWAGTFLYTSGFILLFLSLSQSVSAHDGWRTPYVIAMLVTGFVVLVLATTWVHYLERKTTFPPILRISIVTRNNGRVAVVLVTEFLCVCGYGGLIYTSNIFWQHFEDLTPSELMWRFLPGRIVGTICNITVGLLAAKIAGQYFFFVGSCCTALANVLYAIMDEKATYWTYQFFGQALSSVGSEVGGAVASIYIANVVDLAEVAVAGATLQFAIMLANVCAPSFSTLIYTRLVIAKNGSLLTQEESKKNGFLLRSLRASFWFWAALGCLAAALTAAFLRNLGKVGKKDPEGTDGDGEGEATALTQQRWKEMVHHTKEAKFVDDTAAVAADGDLEQEKDMGGKIATFQQLQHEDGHAQ